MKKILCIMMLFLMSEAAVNPRVPSHLLVCYRAGGLDLGAPCRLDLFISILKKLESNSQLDMRMLSAALLRSLRHDGIEEAPNPIETEIVLPYRASAFQFHRYKLLMDLFVPSQDLIEVDEILTPEEKCLLHKLISSTVKKWERGDESIVCPMSATQTQRQNIETLSTNSSRVYSRCPIEDGVIQTKWGTIAPGTLIAAIASALEFQRVLVTDILNAEIFKSDVAEPLMASAKQEWFADIETLTTDNNIPNQSDIPNISNVWVATLSGDLAEIVVNQGPRVGAASQKMTIGSNNRWNDTLLPRDYYLFPQNQTDWHMTDAEILAGIDGFILSNYVSSWVQQRRTLRLSHIMEMYYSNEGVSFDTTVKACNRQTLFTKLFDSSKLLEETSRFAHVLFLRQGGVYIPREEMDKISAAAVSGFTSYLSTIFRQYHEDCQASSSSVSPMELIIATDAAWKEYEVKQFISWVGGALELNLERSSIGLLHGNTGSWIVEPTNNFSSVFSQLNNFTDEWPNRLNVPTVISSVLQHSLNKSELEEVTKASAGLSTVVLLISPSDKPSAIEIDRSRDLMNSLRTSYFDVYFAYASKELTPFQNINYEYMDYSELFLMTESSAVQDVISSVETYILNNEIPIRIIGAHCPVNETVFYQTSYEDFVLPSRKKTYRIHPYYLLQQNLINIQFRNDGQGQLLVCTWRGADASHKCQNVVERDVISINMTSPCPSPDFCPPAYLVVSSTTTQNLCAHSDCHRPNQVGYYIQHTGLRCLALRGGAAAVAVGVQASTLAALSLVISMFILRY